MGFLRMNPRSLSRGCLLLAASSMLALTALAQQPEAGTWAWKTLLTHDGVTFKYIFYARADTQNNGVVVMLVNTNDYAVRYRFKIIFRADGEEVVEETSGDLGARQAKTGDADGLFWIPFPDGRSIGEVGLRGYRITPKKQETQGG